MTEVHVLITPAEQIKTVTTDLLGIKHPVLLAGMNVAAGPKLAAAVTNCGGLGVIGGFTGILTAFVAWYGAAAVVTNATWGRTVLPVGPRS